MSSLNPGTGGEFRASFRRWNAIESGDCPPLRWFARRNEMRLLRQCLEFDIRPYDGEPLTDRDIGGCLALHKQLIQHTQDGSRLALHLEYRGDSSLNLFPEFQRMKNRSITRRS